MNPYADLPPNPIDIKEKEKQSERENPLRMSNDTTVKEKLMPTLPSPRDNYNTIQLPRSSSRTHIPKQEKMMKVDRSQKFGGQDRKERDDALKEFFNHKKNLKAW